MDKWYLENSDFFVDMEEEKQAFIEKAIRVVFKKKDIVFAEGDCGGHCYYIGSGVVRIFNIAVSGKEPIIFIQKPGALFGISEVIDGFPRRINAQVLTTAVLYRLESVDFIELLQKYPKMATRGISLLGRRIRYLGESISNLMTCNVMGRLGKTLIFIAYDTIHENGFLRAPVRLPVQLSQKQLADMTGSTQPTISELLHELQREGLITLAGKSIILNDTESLLRKAGIEW